MSRATRDALIAPSILAADFARLADDVARVGNADWLHVDVMDGHFVPDITIGPPVIRSLRAATELPLDCHLMVDDPETWAPRLAEMGAANVTFHAEAADRVVDLARTIRATGARAGLAIDRDTPVEPYLPLLAELDTVLIMTIKAGAGGQAFIPELLDKVRRVRAAAAAAGLRLDIEVDGGISPDTVAAAAEAGANAFVAGTAVFGAEDPARAVAALRGRARAALRG